MGFKKIVAPSIKEIFISQVQDMVLSGEMLPGDKLPSERELADTMGISKTIIHEGIRELVRIGFLKVESRKGVYVADFMKTGNLDTLLAILHYRGGMPDRRLLSDLMDIRIGLEMPAIEHLAKNHSDEDIAELRKMTAEIESMVHKSNDEAFATKLFLYRRNIVEFSGNMISVLIMNAFFEASIPAWARYCKARGKQNVLDDLNKTTDYLEAGDSDAALSLLREGLNQYKDYLLKNEK